MALFLDTMLSSLCRIVRGEGHHNTRGICKANQGKNKSQINKELKVKFSNVMNGVCLLAHEVCWN